MVISNLKISKNTLDCDFISVPCQIVNGIRRIIIGETPQLVIGNVVITENNSRMPNEVLEHRLRQIPILVRPKSEGWEAITISLEAEAKGKTIEVTTADFVTSGKDVIDTDRDIKAPILFHRLSPGEKVKFTSKLVLDKKGSHSWNASFRNKPSEELYTEPLKEYLKDVSEEEQPIYKNVFMNNIAQTYSKPDEFEFHLESDGVVDPKTLMRESIEILRGDMLDWFAYSEKETKVDPIDGTAFRITSDKVSHTVGSIIQAIMYRLGPKVVHFVAYDKPHPLKPELIVRFATGSETEDPAIVLGMAKVKFMEYVEKMLAELV
jgi:DNA-directed RNA polymerase subunit L